MKFIYVSPIVFANLAQKRRPDKSETPFRRTKVRGKRAMNNFRFYF